jgi:hypothetical protein
MPLGDGLGGLLGGRLVSAGQEEDPGVVASFSAFGGAGNVRGLWEGDG